jgi:hypothetical protein
VARWLREPDQAAIVTRCGLMAEGQTRLVRGRTSRIPVISAYLNNLGFAGLAGPKVTEATFVGPLGSEGPSHSSHGP